jgi:hypothetical protein
VRLWLSRSSNVRLIGSSAGSSELSAKATRIRNSSTLVPLSGCGGTRSDHWRSAAQRSSTTKAKPMHSMPSTPTCWAALGQQAGGFASAVSTLGPHDRTGRRLSPPLTARKSRRLSVAWTGQVLPARMALGPISFGQPGITSPRTWTGSSKLSIVAALIWDASTGPMSRCSQRLRSCLPPRRSDLYHSRTAR